MRIIYEDARIIAVHKEAGLATQTARIGQKDLVSEIMNYLKRSGVSRPFVGVINRLDQPVEGIVILAKNSDMASKLSALLGSDKIDKYYEAIVLGCPNEKENRLTDYMKKDKSGNMSVICDEKDPGAKKAILEYEVMSTKNEGDLTTAALKIHLITGRHHQIRLQLSSHGFPILGDKKYGGETVLGASVKLGIRNVALKCNRMSFIHPETGDRIDLVI